MTQRSIETREKILIQYLLSLVPEKSQVYTLPDKVTDLDDGGMGSIGLVLDKQSKYGGDLIQVKYLNEDDVLVIITLIHDELNRLFELEMWKVDFSALKRYPTPAQLIIEV